jgi:hypothetical protein
MRVRLRGATSCSAAVCMATLSNGHVTILQIGGPLAIER